MFKKLLSVALLSMSFFYVQAQVTFSPATPNDDEGYSYNFGEVLQDTAGGGKYNRDVTFTLAGMGDGDTYSIQIIGENLNTDNAGGCTVTEIAPYSIQGDVSGTIETSGTNQFTVRFNPKAIEHLEPQQFNLSKTSEELKTPESEIICVPNGNYSGNYGTKTAKIQITHTPFCQQNLAKTTEKVVLCPGSTVYEIDVTGKSVAEFTTFSPAVVNSETGTYSYDFGEVLQDSVQVVKHNKDITFTLGGGLEENGTFTASLVQSTYTHTNGSCTSTETFPYSIVSGTSGTYSTNKEIVVRFNPQNIEEMVAEDLGDNQVEIIELQKTAEVICNPSGNYVDLYGTKTAVLQVVFTPYCNQLVELSGADEQPIAVGNCPVSTTYEIALTGESVEKFTETSTYDVQNTVIVAYPNPVSDILNFEGEGVLYTAQGELVGEGTNTIDVSSLATGLYVLQTQYGMTKIIKK